MRTLGNKVAARNLAVSVGVPVMPATGAAAGRRRRDQAPRRGGRLSGDAEGLLGRRRARHAADRERGRAARRRAERASARRRPPSARTRSISKSWCAAPATSKCSFSATRTAISCISSSAIARSSAATRRSSSARRRPISTTATREALCEAALDDRQRDELCRRRHGRIPDGCRYRQVLFHRGQSAHPGRAHRHRSR